MGYFSIVIVLFSLKDYWNKIISRKTDIVRTRRDSTVTSTGGNLWNWVYAVWCCTFVLKQLTFTCSFNKLMQCIHNFLIKYTRICMQRVGLGDCPERLVSRSHARWPIFLFLPSTQYMAKKIWWRFVDDQFYIKEITFTGNMCDHDKMAHLRQVIKIVFLVYPVVIFTLTIVFGFNVRVRGLLTMVEFSFEQLRNTS